jgi:glycerol uptake facilitator-like aquaporin
MDYASQDSPTESLNSKNLGTKQYFLVNLSKFIVEMVGTATLGIFYLMIGDQPVGMLLGLWVIILFGEAISGAHYNPAITLVFMLRKNSTHLGSSRLKGIFYIGAQFLGGIIAAGAGFFLNRDNKNYVQPAFKITEDKDGDFSCGTNNIPAMISECTGAFVFIFLFMICTDKKTQYSDDKVINCFIMSASYTAARLMGGGGLVSTMFDAEGLKVNGENVPDTNGELPALYCLTNTTTRMEPVGPLLNPALALG